MLRLNGHPQRSESLLLLALVIISISNISVSLKKDFSLEFCIPLSSVVAAEAVVDDGQFLVTSFDGFSVFITADDVSKPDTKDASAVNKQVSKLLVYVILFLSMNSTK